MPPTNRPLRRAAALGLACLALSACDQVQTGPVQIVGLSPQGKQMWRRSIDAYPFTQPVGNVALIAVPDSDEVVLAADEIAAGEAGAVLPTGVIHVEQFRIEEGGGMIPWPPILWPEASAPH